MILTSIENRIVVDAEWAAMEKYIYNEPLEYLNGPGYTEADSGIFVPDADAYKYAMERISQDEELKQEFVEWFYSVDWVREE